MTRGTSSKLVVALFALAAVPACGSQSGADYAGESLFTIQATVEVPKAFVGKDLVPVMAFGSRDPSTTSGAPQGEPVAEIADFAVRGSFPSSFTLDVFDPPSEAALHYNEDDGQPYAIGYLAAMAPSHPSFMKVTHPLGNRFVTRYCSLDESRCFDETRSCPNDDLYSDECTIDTAGDPDLAFAGYSVNVILFYAPDLVPAESWLSFVWAGGEAIAAGYHLYRRVENDWPEGDWSQCYTDNIQRGYEDYNAAYGTHLSSGDDPTAVEFPRDLEVFQWIRQKQEGCFIDQRLREIRDAGTNPVSITLGALRPIASLESD
jgi:hypothetical protein